MDDRLLILERNRLFRLWGQLYRAASRLYHGGNLSDLRTPGDYTRWVHHEQQQLAAENHHPITGPLISVVTNDDLSQQSYTHWERVADPAAANGDFILQLHPGDRLSPHALHNYAQAHSRDDSAALFYSDEDHIDNQGNRTDPLFKPGWSPELLRSTGYLGRSVLYRRDIFPHHDPSLASTPHPASPLPPKRSLLLARQPSATPAALRCKTNPDHLLPPAAPGRRMPRIRTIYRRNPDRNLGSPPPAIGKRQRHAALCRTFRRRLNSLPWPLRLCAYEQSGRLPSRLALSPFHER